MSTNSGKAWSLLGAFIMVLGVEIAFASAMWKLCQLLPVYSLVWEPLGTGITWKEDIAFGYMIVLLIAIVIIGLLMIYVLYLYLQMIIEYINIKNDNDRLQYKIILKKIESEEKTAVDRSEKTVVGRFQRFCNSITRKFGQCDCFKQQKYPK